jgi:uncharacterized protein (TIGR02594 family)
MSDTPDWLLEMRALTGLTETPGSADNPKILAMADTIAKAYPDMAAYCSTYQHDETPWCGLTVAYCMTRAGIRPVWGPTDTDRWLWAQAWDDPAWGDKISEPRPGCVVVMTRSGGGHVTLYERTEGSYYVCRGGNQSDAVNTQSYSKSSVIALMWPKSGPPLPPAPPAPRAQIKKGSTGPDVVYLQTALGIPADGQFGSVTDGAVRGYQTATGLTSDGVVGTNTWTKVDALVARMKAGENGISDALIADIAELAKTAPIQSYNWKDRGRSPPGYIAGMGAAYALALTWLMDENDPAAVEMAQKAGSPDTDALAWYSSEFTKLGMSNAKAGKDTLRHLFVLMIGLGMRESSGTYCCGRDQSATNVTSDTAEAGLFQTSWNIKTASQNLPALMEDYWADPRGFLHIFSDNVQPSSSDLQNYGSGQGASYQWLAKYSPAFAVMVTAIGLRTRRNHWGPINNKAAELRDEADDFLREVEALVLLEPQPGPEPEPVPEPDIPEVRITTTGTIRLWVNGQSIALE